MSTITAIHVDDDIRSLESLKNIATQIPNLELKGSFLNPTDALEFLKENNIDILFSDIEMPEHNGLWLAQQIKYSNTKIVFISSHTEYALNAFEVCAIDYVTKPVQVERLKQVLVKYENSETKGSSIEQIHELFENYLGKQTHPHRIFINSIGNIRIVNLKDVIYFSAKGSYTNIYSMDGAVFMSSKPIKIYLETLEKHPDFVRIHRSFFINKNCVKSLNKSLNSYSVTMVNDVKLDVSQTRKDEIFKSIMN